jgi:hypothetical protein
MHMIMSYGFQLPESLANFRGCHNCSSISLHVMYLIENMWCPSVILSQHVLTFSFSFAISSINNYQRSQTVI